MKKLLKRLALFALSLFLSLVLLEGLLTAYAWWSFGTINVADLERIQTGNVDAVELKAEGAGRSAGYYPHPYLTYVTYRGPDDKRDINNVGLIGPNVPLRKDSAKFTILLTGGSVAAQLSSAGENGRGYLERALETRFDIRRPVVVLNGSNGGWHQPQQAIMALLYGEVADAIVTLDGFNELFAFEGKRLRLECPFRSFDDVNPMARMGFGPLVAAWRAQQLKHFALEHPWRSVYFATRAGREWLRHSAQLNNSGGSTEDSFRLPKSWSQEEQFAFNAARYKQLLRSIDALGDLHGARVAHFIQPCPAVGKTLTPPERKVVGKLEYGETYREMVQELLLLQKEGVPIVDSGDVFSQTSETIYADHIHCERGKFEEPATGGPGFSESTGYRLMAERMADELGRLWQLDVRK